MTHQTVNTATETHVIVTDNEVVLERGLTLKQAESQLCYYLSNGEDAFIGSEIDWPQ